MDIRELFKGAFNEDLPISGGMGNSVYSVYVDPPFWDVDPPTKQAIRVRA